MMMNKGASYNNQVEIELKGHANCFQKHENLPFCFNGLIPFTFCWCCTSYILKRHSSYYRFLKNVRFKLELICITLVGPEPVPLPRNLEFNVATKTQMLSLMQSKSTFGRKDFLTQTINKILKTNCHTLCVIQNAWTY